MNMEIYEKYINISDKIKLQNSMYDTIFQIS